MLDFEIELTGIKDSVGGLLKSACISLLAVDALLSMNISVSDKKNIPMKRLVWNKKLKN